MVFLLHLCGRGGGVVVTISSSSHLTGSLLPRICMTSTGCHLENFSSLRKNQHLGLTVLFAPVCAEDLSSQGRKRAEDKSSRWTWPGGGRRYHSLGEVRESWACCSNPVDVRTGLALQSGLGQRSPSPFELGFVYMPVVGGGNVELGRRKLKQESPFPWPPAWSSMRQKTDHTPQGSHRRPLCYCMINTCVGHLNT